MSATWFVGELSSYLVIAVLNGIEISHKLFTPEMVADARATRGCESVLGMPVCRHIPVQLWTSGLPTVRSKSSRQNNASVHQIPDSRTVY